MKTYDNIDISNTSYTNKDFGVIYPELLDLTKDLTDRWDPSLSNESDPGVVLIKHAAFIGDHNNYNIDKNTLENFAPSATRDKSMRNICEMNGYEPRYYQSASGYVTFILTSLPEDMTTSVWSDSVFTIPKFTINVTSSDDSVNYVQAESVTISSLNTSYPVKFIEGSLQTLTVNNSSTVTMDNINSKYRLYFPEATVAENGIYITSNDTVLGNEWTKVNYILTKPLGSYVYSLDYDSDEGLPYIQFPEDVASLIGSGITVKYVRTTGSNGNIASGQLCSLTANLSFTASDDTAYTFTDDNFTISNLSAIINGKDPEDIDEMYNSFMHTVGTFETLVSCLDYSNAVYNAKNDEGDYIVSNGFVTDKRTDYNYATSVISYNKLGQFLDNISFGSTPCQFTFLSSKPSEPSLYDVIFEDSIFKYYNGSGWVQLKKLSFKEFTSSVSYTSPYDLFIYALNAYSLLDYDTDDYYTALENSFSVASSTAVKEVKDSMEEYKTINHTYRELQDEDIVCFKNLCPINVSITPYEKVSSQEKDEILQSVYIALTENFNAREVLFGEELVYDDVAAVIKGADSRIKSVALSDFTYNPVALYNNGKEVSVYDSDLITDVVAKNVLAGRIALYSFDEDFDHDFGQTNSLTIENPSNISTELQVDMSNGSLSNYVTLHSNDYITIVSPQYSASTTYGEYVNYEVGNVINSKFPIPDGTLWKLEGTEWIEFTYSVDGSKNYTARYGAGTYIRPNGFDITGNVEGTIATDCSIEICAEEYVKKQNTTVPCLWIRNTTDNVLFREGENFTVLNQGEYFIIANSDYSSFNVYGTGTIIQRNSGSGYYPYLAMNKIKSSSITDSNLTSKFSWYQYTCDSNTSLMIYKANVINLTDGAQIYVTKVLDSEASSEGLTLDNEWKYIDDTSEGYSISTIVYRLTEEDDWSTIDLVAADDEHFIRSRFDLSIVDKVPQALKNYDSKTKEVVYLTYKDDADNTVTEKIYGSDSTSSKVQYINCNKDVSYVGDTNIDSNLVRLSEQYNVKFYAYEKDVIPFTTRTRITYEEVEPTLIDTKYTYNPSTSQYVSYGGVGKAYIKNEDNYANLSVDAFEVGDTESKYVLGFGYETTLSTNTVDNVTYAIPMYLTNSSDLSNTVKVTMLDPGIDDGAGRRYVESITQEKIYDYTYSLSVLNGDNLGRSTYIPNNQMYILVPVISYNGSSTDYTKVISADIKLQIDVEKSVNPEYWAKPVLKLDGVKLLSGANEAFSTLTSVGNVVNRVKEIIENSSDPDIYVYWLYEPEKSMVIENDDFTDAMFMFDKNNVVRDKTIAEVDLRNSNITIAKAMRNYD